MPLVIIFAAALCIGFFFNGLILAGMALGFHEEAGQPVNRLCWLVGGLASFGMIPALLFLLRWAVHHI